MTRKEINALISRLCQIYETEVPKELLELWQKKLAPCAANIAWEAAEDMPLEQPASSLFGKFPDIAVFFGCYERAREKKLAVRRAHCPCCQGSTWVGYEKEGQVYVTNCPRCYTPPKRSTRARLPTLDQVGLDVCANLHCENPRRETAIHVPAGQGAWWKKRLWRCQCQPAVLEVKYEASVLSSE